MKKGLKSVAAVTLFFFLTTQCVSAAPGAGIQMAGQRELPSYLSIDIPEELGTLDSLYEAPAGANPQFILHIQNAHANYQAQMKIKQLLGYMNKKYGFKTIFVEGASEKLDADYLRLFPDQERNMKLCDELAKQGELTGAELFLMEQTTEGGGRMAEGVKAKTPSTIQHTSFGPIEALGIEEASLYRANYDALKKVFGAEADVTRFFKGFDGKLDKVASQTFTPETRELISDWKRFEQGRREFMPFVKVLAAKSKKVLKVDLESLFAQVGWPQITRLLVIQQMEKDLNKTKGLEEKAALVKMLRTKGVSKELLVTLESFSEGSIAVGKSATEVSPREVLERLAQEAGPKGFKFSDYPAFSLYAGYVTLRSELDPKVLFDEIEYLFTQMLDTLAKEPAQQALLSLYRDGELLRKLLHLELNRAQWQQLLADRDQIAISSLVSRLRTAVQTTDQRPETGNPKRPHLSFPSGRGIRGEGKSLKSPVSSLGSIGEVMPKAFAKKMDELFTAGLEFYDFAHKREAVFYKEMRSQMQEKKITKAILITGGFHTDGMSDLFRENAVSYGIVTPRLSEKSDENLYQKIMLQNRQYPFEVSYLEQLSHAMPAERWFKFGGSIKALVGGFLLLMTTKFDMTLPDAVAQADQLWAAKNNITIVETGRKDSLGRSEIRVFPRTPAAGTSETSMVIGDTIVASIGPISSLNAPVPVPAVTPAPVAPTTSLDKTYVKDLPDVLHLLVDLAHDPVFQSAVINTNLVSQIMRFVNVFTISTLTVGELKKWNIPEPFRGQLDKVLSEQGRSELREKKPSPIGIAARMTGFVGIFSLALALIPATAATVPLLQAAGGAFLLSGVFFLADRLWGSVNSIFRSWQLARALKAKMLFREAERRAGRSAGTEPGRSEARERATKAFQDIGLSVEMFPSASKGKGWALYQEVAYRNATAGIFDALLNYRGRVGGMDGDKLSDDDYSQIQFLLDSVPSTIERGQRAAEAAVKEPVTAQSHHWLVAEAVKETQQKFFVAYPIQEIFADAELGRLYDRLQLARERLSSKSFYDVVDVASLEKAVTAVSDTEKKLAGRSEARGVGRSFAAMVSGLTLMALTTSSAVAQSVTNAWTNHRGALIRTEITEVPAPVLDEVSLKLIEAIKAFDVRGETTIGQIGDYFLNANLPAEVRIAAADQIANEKIKRTGVVRSGGNNMNIQFLRVDTAIKNELKTGNLGKPGESFVLLGEALRNVLENGDRAEWEVLRASALKVMIRSEMRAQVEPTARQAAPRGFWGAVSALFLAASSTAQAGVSRGTELIPGWPSLNDAVASSNVWAGIGAIAGIFFGSVLSMAFPKAITKSVVWFVSPLVGAGVALMAHGITYAVKDAAKTIQSKSISLTTEGFWGGFLSDPSIVALAVVAGILLAYLAVNSAMERYWGYSLDDWFKDLVGRGQRQAPAPVIQGRPAPTQQVGTPEFPTVAKQPREVMRNVTTAIDRQYPVRTVELRNTKGYVTEAFVSWKGSTWKIGVDAQGVYLQRWNTADDKPAPGKKRWDIKRSFAENELFSAKVVETWDGSQRADVLVLKLLNLNDEASLQYQEPTDEVSEKWLVHIPDQLTAIVSRSEAPFSSRGAGIRAGKFLASLAVAAMLSGGTSFGGDVALTITDFRVGPKNIITYVADITPTNTIFAKLHVQEAPGAKGPWTNLTTNNAVFDPQNVAGWQIFPGTVETKRFYRLATVTTGTQNLSAQQVASTEAAVAGSVVPPNIEIIEPSASNPVLTVHFKDQGFVDVTNQPQHFVAKDAVYVMHQVQGPDGTWTIQYARIPYDAIDPATNEPVDFNSRAIPKSWIITAEQFNARAEVRMSPQERFENERAVSVSTGTGVVTLAAVFTYVFANANALLGPITVAASSLILGIIAAAMTIFASYWIVRGVYNAVRAIKTFLGLPLTPQNRRLDRNWFSAPVAVIKPRVENALLRATLLRQEAEKSLLAKSVAEMEKEVARLRPPFYRLKIQKDMVTAKKDGRDYGVSVARAQVIVSELLLQLNPAEEIGLIFFEVPEGLGIKSMGERVFVEALMKALVDLDVSSKGESVKIKSDIVSLNVNVAMAEKQLAKFSQILARSEARDFKNELREVEPGISRALLAPRDIFQHKLNDGISSLMSEIGEEGLLDLEPIITKKGPRGLLVRFSFRADDGNDYRTQIAAANQFLAAVTNSLNRADYEVRMDPQELRRGFTTIGIRIIPQVRSEVRVAGVAAVAPEVREAFKKSVLSLNVNQPADEGPRKVLVLAALGLLEPKKLEDRKFTVASIIPKQLKSDKPANQINALKAIPEGQNTLWDALFTAVSLDGGGQYWDLSKGNLMPRSEVRELKGLESPETVQNAITGLDFAMAAAKGKLDAIGEVFGEMKAGVTQNDAAEIMRANDVLKKNIIQLGKPGVLREDDPLRGLLSTLNSQLAMVQGLLGLPQRSESWNVKAATAPAKSQSLAIAAVRLEVAQGFLEKNKSFILDASGFFDEEKYLSFSKGVLEAKKTIETLSGTAADASVVSRQIARLVSLLKAIEGIQPKFDPEHYEQHEAIQNFKDPLMQVVKDLEAWEQQNRSEVRSTVSARKELAEKVWDRLAAEVRQKLKDRHFMVDAKSLSGVLGQILVPAQLKTLTVEDVAAMLTTLVALKVGEFDRNVFVKSAQDILRNPVVAISDRLGGVVTASANEPTLAMCEKFYRHAFLKTGQHVRFVVTENELTPEIQEQARMISLREDVNGVLIGNRFMIVPVKSGAGNLKKTIETQVTEVRRALESVAKSRAADEKSLDRLSVIFLNEGVGALSEMVVNGTQTYSSESSPELSDARLMAAGAASMHGLGINGKSAIPAELSKELPEVFTPKGNRFDIDNRKLSGLGLQRVLEAIRTRMATAKSA